jgi:hypothetical protein
MTTKLMGKMLLRITLVLILCLAVLLSSKGRSAIVLLQLPTKDQELIIKHLGAKIVGDAVRSEPIEDPAALFPFSDKRGTYQFTSGKNSGKRQTEALTKIPRPGGKFVWRLDLAPSLVAFLRETPEGDVVMPAVADTGEDALVVTNPPNPFLSKGMEPGETRSYSQRVSVRYFDDLSNERYGGTLKTEYTYLGTFRVTVPAGRFDAILLRAKIDGKIGPAHIHATSYSFFAPGTGLIAMILQQKITAFWVYNVDGVGGKVLVSR